ncbi:MAG: 50S ribosomal protein L25 [Candidatus Eisenbacteria bacterium]|uniref:Large ribosomal subunit protein bL25 n=1 Tax=Eiseniibacteriota bacterium TaxID=2212470 RepID=A0A938BN57_UNCEI|nr:50S ribosomal protein L25 [Candidatus Eisenbacteria bacterium]
MSLVELAGRNREDKGKGAAHRLRAEGLLPGVVYGSGENRLVAVERHGFEGVLRRAVTGTVLIDLALPDGSLRVLIKEVQRDPATAKLLHVDFLRISMDRPIRLKVPLRFTGVPEGVRTEGGMLEHLLREMEVECLPGDVPEFIEIDVSALNVGQSIHARDIVRERVQILTPPERAIAVVHGKAVEATPAAAAAAPAEAAAEAKPGAEKKAPEKDGKKS